MMQLWQLNAIMPSLLPWLEMVCTASHKSVGCVIYVALYYDDDDDDDDSD